MAGHGGNMSDIQRRAAEDPEAGFRAFDSYPWQMDRVFSTQLSSALEGITPDGSNLSGAALQVRIQRFQQQTGITINGEAYANWLAQNKVTPPRIVTVQTIAAEFMTVPDPKDRKLALLLAELGDPLGEAGLQPHQQQEGQEAQPARAVPEAPVPSWQSAAPTAELFVPKDSGPTDPDKEPYPKKFEEIVEFLQTGKEIPGIKKIPDTVIEDPSITTHGRLAAPKKPWEKRVDDQVT